ncbi:copper resistance CopC family protein [Serinibacter salmoneus]|uniref:CopC domain-containing protein n=1 Tax=Serinibacter salmoneus TaxID=556530 RepID=A0A2A9CYS8_9MICO|nr:copper resistance CopC family protein [Serinibacter salmoneus]PFG18832.1 hypothetical protein ATL40_0376 [Serinibacter salmoneus]
MPARLWRAVRTTLGLGVLAAASLVLAPAGLAHDQLIASTPAAGEALPTPPAEVVLTMSGDALDIGTTVMVTDLDGADHAGAITIAGPDVRVEVADLEDGFYDVRWRIVSSDGHPVSGVVPFSVGDVGDRPTAQPDTGPAEASGQATANPPPSGDHDDDQSDDRSDAAATQAATGTIGPLPPLARTLVVGGGGALAGLGALALILAVRRIRHRTTRIETT